ncbi:MAG: hypothetical protein A2Y07_03705 [Planctomycetes bacterium GWF2_50_10]|nr:MAG: hypothetical protein A2Y07_03705 [Planctomycetes bacterium GWF2_50_10]
MTENDVKVPGPKLAKNKKYMLVKYGRMGILGWFEHEESQLPKVHSFVVIKTERGLELGEIVGPQCYKCGQFRFSEEQVDKYYVDSGADHTIPPAGEFQRYATSQDLVEQRKLAESALEELDACRKASAEMNLDMKIVAAEHLFGGERIIFYFLAEGRVDFRDLVKRLAREYQTRIEMRQIGSRDEAKIIGDYETCGMECCCKKFLKFLKPVNMRMAKLQKATLDPSKISGHCGRLKCCLRYEDETYQHLRNNLPRKNTLVSTPHGQGRVIDGQVLTQLVLVVDEQGTEFAVPLADVTVISEQGGDNRTQAPRPQVTRPEPKIEEPAAAEEPVEDTQPEEPQQSLDDQQPLDNEEEAENPEENK